jgi:hypothetical protein
MSDGITDGIRAAKIWREEMENYVWQDFIYP